MKRFLMPLVLAVGLVAGAVGIAAAATPNTGITSCCPGCSHCPDPDHCPFRT